MQSDRSNKKYFNTIGEQKVKKMDRSEKTLKGIVMKTLLKELINQSNFGMAGNGEDAWKIEVHTFFFV